MNRDGFCELPRHIFDYDAMNENQSRDSDQELSPDSTSSGMLQKIL